MRFLRAGPFVSPCPGPGTASPWLCFRRVLGCTPFIALAYFFLWFLPPFTSLRGLWYTTFNCLFQGLATVSRAPSWACALAKPIACRGHSEVCCGGRVTALPTRLCLDHAIGSHWPCAGLAAPSCLWAPSSNFRWPAGICQVGLWVPGYDTRDWGGCQLSPGKAGGGSKLCRHPSSSRYPTRHSPCC